MIHNKVDKQKEVRAWIWAVGDKLEEEGRTKKQLNQKMLGLRPGKQRLCTLSHRLDLKWTHKVQPH